MDVRHSKEFRGEAQNLAGIECSGAFTTDCNATLFGIDPIPDDVRKVTKIRTIRCTFR